MRRRAERIAPAVLTIALLAAGAAAAATPSGVRLRPLRSAVLGQPLTIELELQGLAAEDVSVSAFYRSTGSERYHPLRFMPSPGPTLRATVPRASTRDLGLLYYLEVRAKDGARSWRFGSSSKPIETALVVPDAGRGRRSARWLGLGAGVAVIVVALRLGRRRRERRRAERAFWIQALRPLFELSEAARRRELERLSYMPEAHPTRGRTVLPRRKVMREYRRLAKLPAAALHREITELQAGGFRIVAQHRIPVAEEPRFAPGSAGNNVYE